MRRNKDALLERLVEITPSRIDEIGSVERHKIYRMLGLKVVTNKDGTLTATEELVGVDFGDPETISICNTCPPDCH